MPLSYRVDTSLRVVFSTAHGVLTGEDLLVHRDRLAEDADVDLDHRQLWDFRGVSEVTISNEDLTKVLASPSPFGPAARRAFVAGNEFGYGMLSMVQLIRGTCAGEIMVFRDIREARRWLALPEEEVKA